MAEITNPRELFLHELGDVLYVEEKLEQEVLPKLIGEVSDPELRKGLEKHLEQTRSHVENVEEVFQKLGQQPRSQECVGFEGLKSEHEQLADETSQDLMDAVVAGSAGRTEHYEIAAYEGLIGMARALGEKDAVDLLEQNLKDDKETARQVESIAKRLAKDKATELASR
jgi:ferritin-like metal-binding protein YciE